MILIFMRRELANAVRAVQQLDEELAIVCKHDTNFLRYSVSTKSKKYTQIFRSAGGKGVSVDLCINI